MEGFPLEVFHRLEEGNLFEYGKLFPICRKKLMWTVLEVQKEPDLKSNRRVVIEADLEGVHVTTLEGRHFKGELEWRERL